MANPFHTEIARIAIEVHGAVQKPAELAEFLELLQDFKPEVMVEVGVYGGGTLYAWKHIAPTVIGIDLLDGGEWPIYPSNGHPRNEHGATMIIGDSHQPETCDELEKILDGQQIDCLFIDGDHTYNGVRIDYELYRPLVRPGGLIAFHDIVSHLYAQNCEVIKLWGEIKDDTAVEIVSPVGDSWGGFGVLHVPSVGA